MRTEKEYRSVRIDFFQGHPKTRGLSLAAKTLAIFLTTPHYAGISVLSVAQMRNALDEDLPTEVVARALADLVAAGIVRWDERYEVVWVVEAFDEQVCRKYSRHPSLAKGAMNHLDTLPAKSPLIAEFLRRYHDWLCGSGVALGRVENTADGPAASVDRGSDGEPDPDDDRWPDGDADPQGEGGVDGDGDPGSEGDADGPRETSTYTRTNTGTGNQGEKISGSSRQARATGGTHGPPRASPQSEFAVVERRMLAAFEHAQGSPATPDMVSGAMELWSEGKATADDLERVVAWWRDNRGEARCYLRQCFQRFGAGAQWARMATMVLGRDPPSRASGGRGDRPQSRSRPPGIDETREAMRRHRERQKSAAT